MEHLRGHTRPFVPCLRGVAILLCLIVFAAACGDSSDSAGSTQLLVGEAALVEPTEVATTPPILVPTVTPIATVAPEPTAASQPTVTPVPTPEAVPTATPTAAPEPTVAPKAAPDTPAPDTATPAATTTAAPAATAIATATTAPVTEPSAPAEAPVSSGGETGRAVTETGYRPLGVAGGIELALPVGLIELIGFHEAGHPGAKGVNAASTGVEMITLDSRSRNTPARSAADIVVPPGEPVVAPATGTIIAANNYILYCQHDDQLVYIEPDGLPGWEVRVFHVEGPGPPVGTRVVAGETRIADSARTLPFESQVDEFSGEPSWPHVHVEVVDTSVPDTRPPGPGCP